MAAASRVAAVVAPADLEALVAEEVALVALVATTAAMVVALLGVAVRFESRSPCSRCPADSEKIRSLVHHRRSHHRLRTYRGCCSHMR